MNDQSPLAPAGIFKAYDIRGLHGSEMDETTALAIELDGISIDYDDWHFNVRPSNTEPLLRLNLESLVSREDMERRRDEVLGLIRA